MKTKIIQNIKSIIIILIFVVGISYVSADWLNPQRPPTDGNVATPINVGGGGAIGSPDRYPQSKTGILNLSHLFTSDLNVLNSNGTSPSTGQVLMADDSDLDNGKVKWGTVSGGGNAGGGEFFGGMYATSTNETRPCPYPNNITGICECPSGFDRSLILEDDFVVSNLGGSGIHRTYYCYK